MPKIEDSRVAKNKVEVPTFSLKEFTRNLNLGMGTPVLFIIKGEDQLERTQRLLETFNKNQSFVGRLQPRPFTKGFIFATYLTSDIQEIDTKWWAKSFLEPKFADFYNSQMAITTSEEVRIIDFDTNKEEHFTHPFFGSLHSAVFDPTGNQLLVASNGFDSIIEIDLSSKREIWRWTAWDHGYNLSPAGVYVTSDSNQAKQYADAGEQVILVEDPSNFGHFGLPTGYRTTHVNEATYDLEDTDFILCTLFHQGTIIRISKRSGESTVLVSGFKSPHGLKKLKESYMVTDTRNGYWYRLNQQFEPIGRVSFRELPGTSIGMEKLEWIQYIWPINENLLLAVDSNRSQAVVFNPYDRIYNTISLNRNWSIQSIRPIEPERLIQLQQLKSEL